MSIATIITWLLGLLKLLRSGGGSRVKLDIRTEKAIEKEREAIDKLYTKMMGIDNELQETIHRIIEAKKGGDTALESHLNGKRDMLFEQFRSDKRKYDNLKGRFN